MSGVVVEISNIGAFDAVLAANDLVVAHFWVSFRFFSAFSQAGFARQAGASHVCS